ncbi:unnamed protein product [Pedinophyceae sp. YPF-701]|nr:unnamed protein product [Pedinophyceae sp. YPF-701]
MSAAEPECPRLRFSTLLYGPEWLGNATITCVAASGKAIAVGTSNGWIHIVDYMGNAVSAERLHKGRVTALSFDHDGEHLASCSSSGTSAVLNLYTAAKTVQGSAQELHAVAIDPRHSQRRTREWVVGGSQGHLVLHSRGWLGNRQDVIHSGEGPVTQAAWAGALIAWCNGRGVRVYDAHAHRHVAMFDVPRGAIPLSSSMSSAQRTMRAIGTPGGGAVAGGGASVAMPAAGLSCQVAWQEEWLLHMRFGDWVQVARVGLNDASKTAASGSSQHYLESLAAFQSGTQPVCGLAPFGSEAIVVSRAGEVPAEDGTPASGATQLSGSTSGFEDDADVAYATLEFVSCRGRRHALDHVAVPGARRPTAGEHGGAADPESELRVFAYLPGPYSQARAQLERELAVGQQGRAGALGNTPGGSATEKAARPRSATVDAWWQEGTDEPGYFLWSARGVVLGRPLEAEGVVSWLTSHGLFQRALDVAEAHPALISEDVWADLRDSALEVLLGQGRFDEAAELGPRLLAGSKTAWERWLYVFARHRQLARIARHIPTGPTEAAGASDAPSARGAQPPRLDPEAYGMVLHALLTDASATHVLHKLVRTWPIDVFDAERIVEAMQHEARAMLASSAHGPRRSSSDLAPVAASPKRRSRKSSRAAKSPQGSPIRPSQGSREEAAPDAAARTAEIPERARALMEIEVCLTTRLGRLSDALALLVQLREERTFEFVHEHGLRVEIGPHVAELLDIDEQRGIALLLPGTPGNRLGPPAAPVAVEDVVRALSARAEACALAEDARGAERWRRRLLHYLEAMDTIDPASVEPHQLALVELVADFAPGRLTPLLRRGQAYALDGALRICEERGLRNEMVVVLGRMGSTERALGVIVGELRDVPRAVDFVRAQRDPALWKDLVDKVLDSPDLLGDLLDCVGGHLDPLEVVRSIPLGVEIPRLRDRIVGFLVDTRCQASLQEATASILRHDTMRLLEAVYHTSARSVRNAYFSRTDNGGGVLWDRLDSMHGPTRWLTQVDAAHVPDALLDDRGGEGAAEGALEQQAGSGRLEGAMEGSLEVQKGEVWGHVGPTAGPGVRVGLSPLGAEGAEWSAWEGRVKRMLQEVGQGGVPRGRHRRGSAGPGRRRR